MESSKFQVRSIATDSGEGALAALYEHLAQHIIATAGTSDGGYTIRVSDQHGTTGALSPYWLLICSEQGAIAPPFLPAAPRTAWNRLLQTFQVPLVKGPVPHMAFQLLNKKLCKLLHGQHIAFTAFPLKPSPACRVTLCAALVRGLGGKPVLMKHARLVWSAVQCFPSSFAHLVPLAPGVAT